MADEELIDEQKADGGFLILTITKRYKVHVTKDPLDDFRIQLDQNRIQRGNDALNP